jgi:predicted SAM-dependent methyltransferase
MEWIIYKNIQYPYFQSIGNASQFAIPYAKHYCKGIGYDIGYGNDEWKFPDAIGIDSKNGDGYDANHLPDGEVDYIYSSHCLEHVECWYETLEYWISKIKKGGILFLYLPDIHNIYWHPWHNKKHKTIFTREIMECFLKEHDFENYMISQVDLNSSFMVIVEI